MYVVRPKKLKRTPKRIALRLGCETRVSSGSLEEKYDYNRDFLIACPMNVKNAPRLWGMVRDFYTQDKHQQREYLKLMGIPTPRKFRVHYPTIPANQLVVVRPLRHAQGQDFHVYTTDNMVEGYTHVMIDGNPPGEPISQHHGAFGQLNEGFYQDDLFPKEKEYRIVYYKGERLWTAVKSNVDPDVPRRIDIPWNRSAGFSRMLTIHNESNDHLKRTNCYDKLEELPLVQNAHFLGIDIMTTDDPNQWVVSEVNFCPTTTIERNLEVLVNAIQNQSASLED